MARRKLLPPWKPTRTQQLAAIRRRVPDLVPEHPRIVFCGINPGLYSAAVGHHFAGPGNLFWQMLLAAGFTTRLLTAFSEHELASLGYGVTNLVPRASASADDVTKEELRAGARTLRRKILHVKPWFLAVCGLVAYRLAFERTKAQVGLQPEKIGETSIWLLPNPSGLNAFHQPAVMIEMFRELRLAVDGVAAKR